MATEIRVRCAQAKKMLSKPNRKIKEIKSLIQKRYNFNDETNKLELSIKPLAYDPACCAAANCENLKFKLLAGTPVRNAANNVIGTVMRQGKAIPKDKAIKRFIVRNIVDASSLRDIKEASAYQEYTLPKLYLKMYYCVEAAVHQRIVRGRSKEGRKVRTPPERKFVRKS